jgi:hypothetical protein
MGDAAQMTLQDTRPNITVSAAAVASEFSLQNHLSSPIIIQICRIPNKTRFLSPGRKVPIYHLQPAKIETE